MNSESNEEGVARALASHRILREETAVKQLLHGKDMFSILPTGFSKTLRFTIFTPGPAFGVTHDYIVKCGSCIKGGILPRSALTKQFGLLHLVR